MSFKSSFESHPVVFGFSLIILGFSVGFAFRGYLPASAAPAAAVVAAATSTCNLQGSEELAKGHNARIENLRQSLAFYEEQSSSEKNIQSYQERYKESASRVRQDILQEIEVFKASVSALSKKCAE
ncbi:apolipoprotein A1/A4/E family protein [Pseudomonas sp. A-B-19]|uniref:apolipoprotein A1/A4/E family protein n=1 Tax=Pseudomonas sp. A-B-19 TaxID=2832405 RepID=UPI001CBCEA23|nr:apolipoprotein A1/A4/E family protein [Pseudomonas sp. A-B-19]